MEGEVRRPNVRINLRLGVATDFYYHLHGEKVYRYGMVYFTRLNIDGHIGWEPHAFTLEGRQKFTRLWNEGRVWVADTDIDKLNSVRSSQGQGGSLE